MQPLAANQRLAVFVAFKPPEERVAFVDTENGTPLKAPEFNELEDCDYTDEERLELGLAFAAFYRYVPLMSAINHSSVNANVTLKEDPDSKGYLWLVTLKAIPKRGELLSDYEKQLPCFDRARPEWRDT